MKGCIIPDRCIACGRCELVAPKLLDYYDNGIIKFQETDTLQKNLSLQEISQFKQAVKVCPTRALLVDDN